jgi:plasmid stability protein
MPNVQIRYVPEDVHRALKEKAQAAGGSLNDYLLEVLMDAAQQMTLREWLDRAKARGPLWDPIPSEEIVRGIKEGHEERDRQIDAAIESSRERSRRSS